MGNLCPVKAFRYSLWPVHTHPNIKITMFCTVLCNATLCFAFSACGGLRTDIFKSVLTAYLPFLALGKGSIVPCSRHKRYCFTRLTSSSTKHCSRWGTLVFLSGDCQTLLPKNFKVRIKRSGKCLAVGHISSKSVPPVPARVEELVSPLMQSSSGGVTNNTPFPKMP